MTIGDIYYTSWGYDQTNVEYFKVIRETDKSVELMAIGEEIREGRLWPVPSAGRIDFHITGNETRWNERKRQSEPNPNYVRDHDRGYSTKLCRRRGGESLRIDDVRTAFKYDGGGRYDTFAAGLPGH